MNIPKPFTKRGHSKFQSSSKGVSKTSIEKGSCVNMEELMQFEAARQRALAQTAPDESENYLTEFVPHRIFINCVDTFNGSHIVEHLSNIKRKLEREEPGEEDYGNEMYENDEFTLRTFQEDKKVSDTYEIIGSLEFLNNPKYSRPEGIAQLLDNDKRLDFLEKLETCGFIIYDITSDLYCHPKQVEEAKWVLESLVKSLEVMEKKQSKAFSSYTHCRVFILISTLLTWAKTKPIDLNDPTLPFTERDFRKRRPHPNYKVHFEFEKRVIELGKKYPEHLKTIVVGAGIPYGHEEDVFHFLFKMAWQDASFLPVFKPGNNTIPVIHIDSLASILQMIIENFPQKHKYIIATDPHSVTMRQLAKLLAKHLGNGKTKLLDKEEAFLFPDIKQRNYDMLTAKINIVPGYIMDNLAIRWGTDLPFAENIPQLIKEFKTARGLLPVKIFLHGPPGSGKTFLAKRLCDYYDIPHLQEKGVIEDFINTLKAKIQEIGEKKDNARTEAGSEKVEIIGDETFEENEEEENDEEEDIDTLRMRLRDIEENMENNGNKLDEEFVLRFFKEKLSSNPCKNKGFVIEGYPETMEQTKLLYAPAYDEETGMEEEEEIQGGNISRLCNTAIMPAYVESLDASDEFLINRVIQLPDVNMSVFEEHEMCRRLTEFRALNTDDNTPLIFYDEMEVHPMIYNVENDPDPKMEFTFQAIINHVGPPRNYGKELTLIETALEGEKHTKKQYQEMKAQREEVKKAAEERRQNLEKWMFLKNQELEMEEKALLVMGMPLRHYLMKYIFPCLTRGLVEVARIRPDDPIDFLSEFLFRENPEGKMFQPNYEEKEEKLAQAIKEYESMLASRQSQRSKDSKKSFSVEKSVRSDAVSQVTDYKCSFISSSTSKTKSGIKSSKSTFSQKSEKSKTSTEGVCTCQKSPSLSTCSSDRTLSTPTSCTCAIPEPCEPCDPCDAAEEKEEEKDECKCPCA